MTVQELKKMVEEDKDGGFKWAIVNETPFKVLELYYLNKKGVVTRVELPNE